MSQSSEEAGHMVLAHRCAVPGRCARGTRQGDRAIRPRHPVRPAEKYCAAHVRCLPLVAVTRTSPKQEEKECSKMCSFQRTDRNSPPGQSRRAVQIAKALKAKVTAIHAYPQLESIARDEFIGPFNLLNKRRYNAKAQETANRYLATVTKAAKAAGIEAEVVAIASDRPHEAIIKTAKRKKCDLIIMGSHGRSGRASCSAA
jgi:hypothetical protein